MKYDWATNSVSSDENGSWGMMAGNGGSYNLNAIQRRINSLLRRGFSVNGVSFSPMNAGLSASIGFNGSSDEGAIIVGTTPWFSLQASGFLNNFMPSGLLQFGGSGNAGLPNMLNQITHTTSHTVSHSIERHLTPWGDKIGARAFGGQMTGSKGLINFNTSTNTNSGIEVSGQSISVLNGAIELGYGTNMSLNLGVSAFGIGITGGVNLNGGLGLSLDGSYTNSNGQIEGYGISATLGGGSLVAGLIYLTAGAGAGVLALF